MEIDENADVVNVLVTTGQLVPTLGKLLLFKLDGAFKATCTLALLFICMFALLIWVCGCWLSSIEPAVYACLWPCHECCAALCSAAQCGIDTDCF